MVSEVIGKEIPVSWLAIKAPHCYKISGHNSVSQKFKTHAWGKSLTWAWLNRRWHSCHSIISTFKNTSVWMFSIGDKLNFTNNTDRVNIFSSKMSKEVVWHSVTHCVKCWAHSFQENSSKTYFAWVVVWFSISSNLFPKLVLFFSSRLGLIRRWAKLIIFLMHFLLLVHKHFHLVFQINVENLSLRYVSELFPSRDSSN